MKKLFDKVLENGFLAPYTDGELAFSCSCIDMEIESGKVLVGAFRITTEDKYKPEGYVYASDLRMLIRTPYFGGLNKEINFQYDTTGLEEGSIQEGIINIVSNLGEYELPYSMQIISSLPVCMLGTVKNLFHFANIAKTNWQEAVDLFYSRQFNNVLTATDVQYRNIYRGFSGSVANELNVDHFLEQVKKKAKSDFTVNTEFINIENPSKDLEKTIIVKFINWGHSALDISCIGEFLETDKDMVSPESDMDTAEIKLYINRSMLYRGNNTAKLLISNLYKTIEVNVTVNIRVSSRKSFNSKRDSRMQFMKLYMDYRLENVNKAEWLRNANSFIGTVIVANPDVLEYRLYQIHLMLLEKRYDDAMKNLKNAALMIEESDYDTDIIGYYNYLLYLSSENNYAVKELVKETEFMYVKNLKNWRLAWFLLYMKDEYRLDEHAKWNFIKKQYDYGCNSPVMFLEALLILKNNPNLMAELSDFELAIMTFAIKHNAINTDMCSRFVFLVSGEIAYSDEIFNLLTYCYGYTENDECLIEICKLLMKGNLTGREYFGWYELAVDKELRINRLYEYYIMSIDLNYEGLLPKVILMYFAYRSNLDYERNAFLYSNVIKHKDEYQEIYNDYEPVILQFAQNEIINGRINDNLAFIYQKALGERLFEAELVTKYADFIFLNQIEVKKPELIKLIVVNSYLNKEQEYKIYNGQLIIPLNSQNSNIFLEDINGNRYMDKEFYNIRPVVKNPVNVDKLMKLAQLDLNVAIYQVEHSGEKITVKEDNEAAFVWLSYCDDISEDFRIEIMINLLEYYFEKDEIARLDELLLRFDPEKLDAKNREICIKIMVARGMYDTAVIWLKNYGTETVDYKIQVRLLDRILVRTDYEYDADLLKMCQSIFKIGKYDEIILKYMVMYQTSSSRDLKELWRAADSFDLEIHNLIEQMLIQILYSGARIGEEENIFDEYISESSNLELEKMFLDKLSYDYFVLEKTVDTQVFDRVVYYHQMNEEISEYLMLAYLKKSCDRFLKGKLNQEEIAIILLFLQHMDRCRLYFPFFLEYRELWSKLNLYQDRCFIEYRGKEANKVVLHYVVEKPDEHSEEYRKEEMPHMIGGIYVWSYVLFYGEKIRYYITEEESRQEKLTSSNCLEKKEKASEHNEYMFDFINNIVISKDMKDDLTYIQLTEEFVNKKYIINRLFESEL